MPIANVRSSAVAVVLLAGSLTCAGARGQAQTQPQPQPQPHTIKPVKLGKRDLSGAVFNRKDAKKSTDGGTAMVDVVGFTSPDNVYQTGVFKSGPSHEVIKGPDGLAYTEFLYFLSGGVKLTSSDGSVISVGHRRSGDVAEGLDGPLRHARLYEAIRDL